MVAVGGGVQGTLLWDRSVDMELSAQPGAVGRQEGSTCRFPSSFALVAFGAHLCCLEKILLYPCFIVP